MSDDQRTNPDDEIVRLVSGIFDRHDPEEAWRLCTEAFGRALARMPLTPAQQEQARAELAELAVIREGR